MGVVISSGATALLTVQSVDGAESYLEEFCFGKPASPTTLFEQKYIELLHKKLKVHGGRVTKESKYVIVPIGAMSYSNNGNGNCN